MSELSAALGEVDGRYRPMPWVIPLMLDDAGEKLIDQDDGAGGGPVRVLRRFARRSLGRRDHRRPRDGRLRHAEPRAVVDGSIERYSELEGGDDKLTCAGTIDSYVRGVME